MQTEKYGEHVICKTSLGNYKICYKENHITYLKRTTELPPSKVKKTVALIEETSRQLKEYLEGKRISFDLPLKMIGTPFQQLVWKTLLNIPYGTTKSYKQIAIEIGNPQAARAIGMANNKNPLTIVIPCHRVIGINGNLTGYAGGIEIKAKLLQLEKKTLEKK